MMSKKVGKDDDENTTFGFDCNKNMLITRSIYYTKSHKYNKFLNISKHLERGN